MLFWLRWKEFLAATLSLGIMAGCPDTGDTDAATTDAGANDAHPSDTGVGDTARYDAGVGDNARYDAGVGDTGAGDTGAGDTGIYDTGVGDTQRPDIALGDAVTVDRWTDDTAVADAFTPDTATPDVGVRDVHSSPDTAAADAFTPDTSTPDVGVRDVRSSPDTTAPDSASTTEDAGSADVALWPQAQPFAHLGPLDHVGWPHRLVFDPTNATVVYAGCDDTMGLFRSQDGGQSWSELTSYGSARSAWALDIASDGRIYAGDNYGLGIRVSSDGGQTFASGTGLAFPFISSISVDPQNPNRAMASAGLDRGYAPDGSAVAPLKQRGAVYSTDNGGLSWTAVPGLPNDAPFNRVHINPGDPSTVLAARTEDIWRSTDGGDTWSQLQASALPSGGVALGAYDFAASPVSPMRVLASAARIVDNAVAFEIWISADAGATWSTTSAPANSGYFYYAVAASPNGWAYAAVGGIYYRDGAAQPSLVIGMRLDQDTSQAPDWWGQPDPPTPAGMLFAAVFHPQQTSQLLLGSMGQGVLRYDGSTWSNTSQGLSGALCEGLGFVPGTTERLLVSCGNLGFSAHLLASDNGGTSWSDVTPPDMAFAGIGNNALLPLLVDRTSEQNPILVGGNTLRRSVDRGDTFDIVSGNHCSSDLSQGPDGAIYSACFEIRRSTDHGLSFDSYGLPNGGCAHRVLADPHQAGRAYAICPNADENIDGIYVSDDGITWEPLPAAGPASAGLHIALAVDPLQPGHLAALLSHEHDPEGSGFGGRVYHSQNDGQSWQEISPPMEGTFPTTLLYLADGPGHLVVGTSSEDAFAPTTNGALWESYNNGTTWRDSTVDLDPSHIWKVGGLLQHPDAPESLYVSTWWRGYFRRQ